MQIEVSHVPKLTEGHQFTYREAVGHNPSSTICTWQDTEDRVVRESLLDCLWLFQQQCKLSCPFKLQYSILIILCMLS